MYESDLEKVITDREAEDCLQGRIPSQKWIKTFRAVAYGWLSYAGILHREQKSDPLEYKVVYDYVQWARDSKGLADATLTGRERELKCFMSFIQRKSGLTSLSLVITMTGSLKTQNAKNLWPFLFSSISNNYLM